MLLPWNWIFRLFVVHVSEMCFHFEENNKLIDMILTGVHFWYQFSWSLVKGLHTHTMRCCLAYYLLTWFNKLQLITDFLAMSPIIFCLRTKSRILVWGRVEGGVKSVENFLSCGTHSGCVFVGLDKCIILYHPFWIQLDSKSWESSWRMHAYMTISVGF